ncbi:glutaminase [Microbacterium sp. zg.Y1090]|uniref:glutaminase n=1 Tax=Microbacterium TaxID=33882 RepID=UPI00214AB98B|nr:MULTISPECIES: glutaminase [unclassified Microbacterium]MCR2813805.1 glutaminase [Microbacterium sp. zg.Y1084]MCR2819681.1 glutaminase [Microbacterium sp. zg.Y1090]MDL5487529.1 glutaminase [Microbacterium sp. zg-Y1211]WIM28075.1 glutaminase [Microbacterium sp. zg-Y1090]
MSEPTPTAQIVADARARLAGLPRERLGAAPPARRLRLFPRAPRLVPVGEAWHLGVLLITDDAVLATGDIVRARREVRRGYTAQSQRERAELAAAAFRGGFAEGETVHVGWRRIDLEAVADGAASGPLAIVDGAPVVRWSAAGGYRALTDYLAERIALLREPPTGAT